MIRKVIRNLICELYLDEISEEETKKKRILITEQRGHFEREKTKITIRETRIKRYLEI